MLRRASPEREDRVRYRTNKNKGHRDGVYKVYNSPIPFYNFYSFNFLYKDLPHGDAPPLCYGGLRPNEKTECVIEQTKIKDTEMVSFIFGSPTETRTPDSALRGLRLNRLTMRPYVYCKWYSITKKCFLQLKLNTLQLNYQFFLKSSSYVKRLADSKSKSHCRLWSVCSY